MSDDVTIDRETARVLAQYHRDRSKASRRLVSPEAAAWHESIAKRLDPPRSLRDEVAEALRPTSATWSHSDPADVVLAVVADWLAAQPVVPNCGDAKTGDGCYVANQRANDVRLLRGGDDD